MPTYEVSHTVVSRVVADAPEHAEELARDTLRAFTGWPMRHSDARGIWESCAVLEDAEISEVVPE
jgi:hypothetical protein